MKQIVAVAVAGACALAFGLGVNAEASRSLRIEVRNETGADLTGLYAAPAGSGAWSRDLVRRRTVEMGESVKVSLDGTAPFCDYDLRMALSNGATTEEVGVDICHLEDHVLILRD